MSETEMETSEPKEPWARRDKPFMCGVCEGFYGKPWRFEQRKDLFYKMHKMQMTTYLYAPKDDYKHRMYWRDLYSPEEAEDLKALIEEATQNEITFVYALSPGLDITYSSGDDTAALKAKLGQVLGLGCTAFALLWDDIEKDLCAEDEEMFKTLAQSQTSVSNAMFKHLNSPKVFLFCPTEYCTTRAVPNLQSSQYLMTLGKKLEPAIDILWTGPRVVSRLLLSDAIQEVAQVIQRLPVIWDNLHANDYDQTRLYLGPYDGRPADVIPFLGGVLTNPNCEYEANFIPFHTLAQWSQNTVQRFFCDKESESDGTEVDIDMDSDTDIAIGSDYQPKKALFCAIQDWIPEFYKSKGTLRIPPNKVVPPMLSVTAHAATKPTDNSESDYKLDATADDVAATKDVESDPTVKSDEKEEEEMETNGSDRRKEKKKMEDIGMLAVNDLLLLCDLFYLPFSHGPRAIELLRGAHYLISEVGVIKHCAMRPRFEQSEAARCWYDKAMRFHENYKDVAILVDKFMSIPNRDLLYELCNYVTDMRSVLAMVNSYIKWNALGKPDKEPYRTGEQEPWVYRGGLHAEFRRLLPVEGQNDMFPPPNREPPSTKVYTIRPYFPQDKEDVYLVHRKTCDNGFDGTHLFPDHPDLPADESIGGLLSLSSDYCYVMEDDIGICGYVCATASYRNYMEEYVKHWIPKMKKKYHEPRKTSNLTPAKELMLSFYSKPRNISDELHKTYPGYLQMALISSRVHDCSATKRLTDVVVRALKAANVVGIHSLVHRDFINTQAMHVSIGFEDVTDDSPPDSMLILGLSI